jgi:hypothetical protein
MKVGEESGSNIYFSTEGKAFIVGVIDILTEYK